MEQAPDPLFAFIYYLPFYFLQENTKTTKPLNSLLTWIKMFLKMWPKKWYVQSWLMMLRRNGLYWLYDELPVYIAYTYSPRLSLATLQRVTIRPWPRLSRTVCHWLGGRGNRDSWYERNRRRENRRLINSRSSSNNNNSNSNKKLSNLHIHRFVS